MLSFLFPGINLKIRAANTNETLTILYTIHVSLILHKVFPDCRPPPLICNDVISVLVLTPNILIILCKIPRHYSTKWSYYMARNRYSFPSSVEI